MQSKVSPKVVQLQKKIIAKVRTVQALHGIELFDEEDNLLLSAGFFHNPKATTREFELDDDERIVGV